MHHAASPTLCAPLPPPPATAVFLPKEHGSWSLTLEPLALGLLVAPSSAGGALAVAALAGFFARRPARAALQPEDSAKRRGARETLGLLGALALAGICEAGVLGGWTALWPLLPAALVGVWFASLDLAGEGRELAAELAGGTVGALLAAAVVVAAGAPVVLAAIVASLVLARSIPAILAVRTYVRTRKGRAAPPGLALGAAVVAAGALLAAARLSMLPWLAAAVGLAWLARTAWLLGPWRPDWSARRIGMIEAGLGLVSVLVLAAACHGAQIAVP